MRFGCTPFCQVYAEGTSLVVIGAVSSGGEVIFGVLVQRSLLLYRYMCI